MPGAQLAVHHGGETVAVQAGEQRHDTGRQVRADAAFPVGSISKVFTATVAMVLVADGDVELDVPLGEYLPDLSELGAVLTLRQVLSHTGGLVSDPDAPDTPHASISRYVLDHCRAENLVQAPGAAFSYSNIGYVLAGRLIESVTGMSWWEATESILLRPLGIEPGFVVTPGRREQGREIVTGHSVNPSSGRIRPVDQSLTPARAPAGALAVSASDLVALGRVLLGEHRAAALLPSAHARQMRQRVPAAEPFGIADGWGLGLALFRGDGTVSAGHDGNAEGTACYLRLEPASGCVVGFTSNATTGLEMWQDVAGELRAAGLPVATYTDSVDGLRRSALLPDCTGSYRNGDADYVVEVASDDELGLHVDGEMVARLACYEDACREHVVFSQQDPESGVSMAPGRFLRDPVTGEIDRLHVDGRVARRQVRSPGEHRRC